MLPRSLLVPDLIVALTTAPELRPVLGRIGVCLNLEFLQRLDRRLHELDVLTSEGVRGPDVVHAVQQEDVVERAVAVHVQDALEVDARQAGRARQHAGREQGELIVVASVQGQLDDLLLVDDQPARRRLCVEQRSCPDDFDGFCELAGAHREVDARDLRDLQRDPCADDFREPCGFGGDGVITWPEAGDDVEPLVIRLGLDADIRLDIRHGHGRFGHDRAGLVFHAAGNRRGFLLGEGGERARNEPRHEKDGPQR